MQVHELAKELNVTSKQIIEILADSSIKGATSRMNEAQEHTARELLQAQDAKDATVSEAEKILKLEGIIAELNEELRTAKEKLSVCETALEDTQEQLKAVLDSPELPAMPKVTMSGQTQSHKQFIAAIEATGLTLVEATRIAGAIQGLGNRSEYWAKYGKLQG